MTKKVVLKSSILAVAAGLSLTASGVFADEVALQMLGVNDFHGALEQTGTARLEGQTVSNAGTAALADAYMDNAQADFENQAAANNMPEESIRVQAGDMVGASPANSSLLQDEPTVQVFNQMGFEYGTLGNHEFDEGLEEYNRITTGQAPAPGQFNSIVENYPHQASQQEIVIANVVDKDTGQIPMGWQPYTIRTIPVNDKEVKVGFVGVITTEFPNLVLKKNHEQYNVLDEAETLAKYTKELNDQGVHAIVVLAHVAATSENGVAAGPAADMIKKLNQLYPDNSVDVVFAGHNHMYTNGMADKTLIVQTTSQGKAFADVRGVLDTDTQDFVNTPIATITAVDPTKGVEPSADVQAIINDANQIVKQVTDAKIGTAAVAQSVTRTVDDDKESALGDLITTAQRVQAKKAGYDVDFAMTNNGGIRADLVVQPDGTITWGAAQAVQPFGNILQVVEMTGQQIYDVLNQQYDDDLYFLQMSGIKYTYTDATPGESGFPKYRVLNATKEDGTPIDPNATYKLVINDFLYGGGDGFTAFTGAKLIGAIDPDTEVFVNYIKDQEAAGQAIEAINQGNKTYYYLDPSEGTGTDTTNPLPTDQQPLPGVELPETEQPVEGDTTQPSTEITDPEIINPSEGLTPTPAIDQVAEDDAEDPYESISVKISDEVTKASEDWTPAARQRSNESKSEYEEKSRAKKDKKLPNTGEANTAIATTLVGGMMLALAGRFKRQKD